MEKIIPTEYQECLMLWKVCQYYPHINQYLVHHANEGKRSIISGSRLKKIGMQPGIPDYQYPVPNNKFLGLWIEMKKIDGKNKKKNINQDKWIEKLNKIGHYATYAYGNENALKIILDYIENKL